jgi:uncharacterized protein YxjI
MRTYEVTRRILSFGPQYDVTGDDGTRAVVRGKILAVTPKLTMTAGEDGGVELAKMEGNFLKTKFECSVGGQVLATLAFKVIAIKKSFTVTFGGRDLKVEGDITAFDFLLRDQQGATLMAISKQLSLRDKFQVTVNDPMPWQVAVMAAVAVDQKYFSDAEIAAALTD